MSSVLQSENTTQRRLLVHLKHLLPTSSITNNQIEQCDSNLNELIEPNVVRGLYTYNDESDRYSSISYNYKHTFDVKKMTLFLSPTFDKKEMFKFLDKPLMLTKNINITKEEAREIALKQVIFLCQSGYFNITDLKKNPELFLQRLEAGIIDASMNVKLGVQLLLFSGSIMNLGTKKHHDLYLKRAERCELPGAFAMTEIEHGSNVRELKTTATFDEKTNEFLINTPNKGAIKWWLGNAACHGVMATVFARLILKGKDYGVHAFLCPIRDPQTMKLMPGVIAGDCGDKIGLHGVDNGFLEFDNVRIPYDNLLDRFGGIDLESKTYKSEFDSAGRRFAAVLGELITGRVSIVSGSLNCRRVGCMIATRYASQRTQFSAGKEFPEQPILDYKSHKVRLMPIIASSYVFEFIKRNVVKKYCRLHLEKVSDDDLQEIHALSAGLKAVMSWDTQTHIQTLREMCGGHGYSAYNRLGTLRNDHDVLKTFEGDNTVLIQQLGGYLLKEFSKQFTGEMVSDSIQYIRKQVGGMAQRNPVITRFSSKKHLRNSDYHLQAFEYRTAKLLQKCALEINVNKKKQGIFRAFGESLPKLVRLGRAYVEQVTLHDYLNGIEDVKDIELKRILKLMGDLYALDTISKNVGDFIDIIKKNKLSAVHDMVEWLCEELRVHAVSLVDSFGFPDFLLDAPIAKRDHGNYVHHILNYSLTRNKENAEFVGKMQTDVVPKRKNIASDSNDINQVMEINL